MCVCVCGSGRPTFVGAQGGLAEDVLGSNPQMHTGVRRTQPDQWEVNVKDQKTDDGMRGRWKWGRPF